MPPNTVYVGRPTVWGNPYKIGDRYICGIVTDAAFAVALYETHARVGIKRSDIQALRGKDLACFCPLERPCHADVLLEMANEHAEVINSKTGVEHGN